jgi:hypothetical protein
MFRKLASAMILVTATASHAQAQTALPTKSVEKFGGFSVNGEAINPVCISRMRPWQSDKDIIVKSIVLEECQKSNWAFHEKPIDIKNDVVSTEVEGENFGYKVIGKTDSGLFIVHHSGNELAAYRIDEQQVKPDMLKPDTRKVHVLTVVSDTFVPCFKRATVDGDTLIIEKNAFDHKAPRATQCKPEVEKTEIKISQ